MINFTRLTDRKHCKIRTSGPVDIWIEGRNVTSRQAVSKQRFDILKKKSDKNFDFLVTYFLYIEYG